MANVNIIINGAVLSVPEGATVLEAAKSAGIHIPTLCYLEKLDPHASCRMCVVEIEGARTLQHACATKVREGMVVRTDTEAVRASRKLTLELLLSDHNVDCHHCLRIGNSRCDDLDPVFCETCSFCDCVRDGFCELQALAREYKVDLLPFSQKHNVHKIDATTAIVRNPNKCVKCKRCVDICGKVQTVHNLCASGRGSGVLIGPAFGKAMSESSCIGCGRCVQVCPTGAIHALEHKDELLYYAHMDSVFSIAQVSEDAIPELERLLGRERGSVSFEQIAGSLRKMGVKYVANAELAEDIVKSKAEGLLDEAAGKGTVVISNNYAAQKFLVANYAELSDSFLFYPSANEEFGRLAKELALKKGTDAGRLKTFAVGGFGAAAVEVDDTSCVDIAINARELYRLMLSTGAEPKAARTAESCFDAERVSCGSYGRLLDKAEWNMEAELECFAVNANGRELRCAICHNLGQLRKAMEKREEFDIIRALA